MMESGQKRIPKTIHYCWLGRKEKPEEIQKYMSTWRKYAPDFEIKEWNEDIFPFEKINMPYVEEAIQKQKWAFVTDVMRLYVLYEYGGIYLDTDVEIIKSMDDLLEHQSFIGFESRYTVCTAVIGARKGEQWLKELLDDYRNRRFLDRQGKSDTMPNSQYIYKFFNEKYQLLMSDSITKTPDGVTVYPADYFSPINYSTMRMEITENTRTIHHYSGAWKSSWDRRKDWAKGMITRVIGETGREKLKRMIRK